MNFMRETEQYYDWLYKIVCGEWEPRNLSFHRLLMYLFNRARIGSARSSLKRVSSMAARPRLTTMLQNHVDFGVTNYVEGDEALNSFINGGERSVMLRFNCDGPIIDKI